MKIAEKPRYPPSEHAVNSARTGKLVRRNRERIPVDAVDHTIDVSAMNMKCEFRHMTMYRKPTIYVG
jgi:hypothetical protein